MDWNVLTSLYNEIYTYFRCRFTYGEQICDGEKEDTLGFGEGGGAEHLILKMN